MKILNEVLKWVVLWQLKLCAIAQLKKSKPYIIGVTGSVGKTSAVYAIEAVLKNEPNLKVTHQVNSETGIPLHILGIKLSDYSRVSWLKALVLAPIKVLTDWQKTGTYLMELGVDGPSAPKNMSHLLSIVSPQTGVLLNVEAVHSQNFDVLIQENEGREIKAKELIAAEKGKLIENLPESGYAILNIDDPNVKAFMGKTKASVVTFGFDQTASVVVVAVTPSLQGTWIKLKNNDTVVDFIVPKRALSRVYGYTFAAAIAVGLSRGISFEQCIENIKTNFTLPNGRMSLLSGVNNSFIIDSSYNASKIPMLEALGMLREVGSSKKLAILGDMRELGEISEEVHRQVAQKAAEVCEKVWLVGPQMKQYALPLLGQKAVWCENAGVAAEKAREVLGSGDVILVKGSQNTLFLEYAVEKLLKNPEEAGKVLCRRGGFWQKEREKIGLK